MRSANWKRTITVLDRGGFWDGWNPEVVKSKGTLVKKF
jgi:hypothetical protein